MMYNIKKDYIASIAIFLFSLSYLVVTFNIDAAAIGNPHAPKYFPFILAVGGIILSSVLFGRTHLRYKKLIAHMSETDSSSTGSHDDSVMPLVKLTLLASVLGIAYAFLFERLGYIISTVLFLVGYMFLINGARSWKLNLLVPIVFSVCTYLVFAKLLSVPLPLFPRW